MEFPDEIVNKLFEPGQICNFYVKDLTKPKRKFVVFVFLEITKDFALFVLINTEPTDYAKRDPNIMKAQHEIKKNDYDFLKYNSYVDCNELRRIPISELHDLANAKKVDPKCAINNDDWEEIKEKIKNSTNISPKLKKMIGLIP